MSHIGKKKIFFPLTTTIQQHKNHLILGNQKTTTRLKLKIPLALEVRRLGQTLQLTSPDNVSNGPTPRKNSIRSLQKEKTFQSMWGTLRATLAKNIQGIFRKHEIQLKFIGVGYRASLKKKVLILRLGFSHRFFLKLQNNVSIRRIKKRPLIFSLQSDFFAAVKQTAFRLRTFKAPEFYKGKGILLVNERIQLKEGKKVKNA